MPANARCFVAVAALFFLLGGCATRGPIDDPATIRELGFLQPGVTRAEVEGRLGQPEQLYEGGRIATYAVVERDGRLATVVSPYGATYTLVVEYAPNGTVTRRSLLRRVR